MVEHETVKSLEFFPVAKSSLAGSWDATVYWRCNSNAALSKSQDCGPYGSNGQSKQAAWQRSLKEHKEASCRVVFEQRDVFEQTGKRRF